MEKIFIILCLILFALTSSCKGNKVKTKNLEIVAAKKSKIGNKKQEENKPEVVEEFNLFTLNDLEENTSNKVGFISLSDKYIISEHPDSLAIPNLKNIQDKKVLQYFILNSEYKKRFFAKTKVSETDSVFVYDYSNDVLLSFPIKNLNVVANLSIYKDVNDYPFDQYDYEIGFEINKKLLEKLSKYYTSCLVYVGKENPFEKGQMTPIHWKKINNNEFPSIKIDLAKTSFQYKNSYKGKAYLFNSDKYKYYIQDYLEKQNNSSLSLRHLVIIDSKNGKVIIEKIFEESEGSSIAPLSFGIDNSNDLDINAQWTGKLFKDKPEVIFGFEYFSFSCPNIIFLNSKKKDVYINCDNRH